MTPNVFTEQIGRLKSRYGVAVFDKEFQKLIWTEVRDLPDKNFKRMIDLMIGEFPNPAWPPKMSDYRDFAHQQRKLIKDEEVAQASKNWKTQVESREAVGTVEGLNKAIKDLGAKSLLDAVMKVRSK